MTCSELTQLFNFFSTSHPVRVNLCSIPMLCFIKAQMILSVKIDAAVLQMCKFLQCHPFSNCERKLVTSEVSEVQVGASAVQSA